MVLGKKLDLLFKSVSASNAMPKGLRCRLGIEAEAFGAFEGS